LDIKVRWSPAFTGFGLVGDLHFIASDLPTPSKIIVGPIFNALHGVVQTRELYPVLVTLRTDLPDGEPRGVVLVLVVQEDVAQFQKGCLVSVWWRSIVYEGRGLGFI